MNRIKHAFVLTVDFIGLLIIGSLVLFVLNYFKIVPLSQTFPNYFGFLPQALQKTAIATPAPQPLASGIIWNKQADPTLITNYSDYFKTHYSPTSASSENSDLFSVSGVFTAYNISYIQTVTSQGSTVFQINNTVFRKISPPITSKSRGGEGDNRITAEYKNANDFFNDVPFGGYLQITYQLAGDLKTAASVDYYPEHKY
jgi:hypothetical protein